MSQTENDVPLCIRKVIDGDSKAFEEIVVTYQKRIYYTVLQMVMNHDDADDVLQETFIKAFTKMDTYDSEYPFYPWLYRIAINTALNHQKKKARQRATSLDDLEGNVHSAELSETPRQNSELEGEELADELMHALEAIPIEQRVVFTLRVSDGLSYQEISDTLDISIGTVMSRLSRAREKLRSLLIGYIETKDVKVYKK